MTSLAGAVSRICKRRWRPRWLPRTRRLSAAARSALDAGPRRCCEITRRSRQGNRRVARANLQPQQPRRSAALWEIDQLREKIDAALADDIALCRWTCRRTATSLWRARGFSVDVNFLDKPAVPVKWTVDKSSLLAARGLDAQRPTKRKHGTRTLTASTFPFPRMQSRQARPPMRCCRSRRRW